MSGLNSQVDNPYASQPQPHSLTLGNRSASAARLANRMRQASNSLQPNGSRQSTGSKVAIAKSGSLGDMLNKVDLSFLSEEEQAKVLGVVQRDLAVRATEKERLKRCRSSILRHDRELAEKSQTTLAESTNCLLCGQKFIVLFQPRKVCANCSRPVCRRCSEPIPDTDGVLCKLCVKETGYRAMKCNWFYDTVINKFREFGSTAVAKNIFGDKYKHIQNMAEEELATVLSRHGTLGSDNREFVVNDQKVAPQTIEQAKDAQLVQLRTKLQTLMQNTAKEYKQLENNNNLTEHQKNWQFGRISMEFRKEATAQMRAFCRTAYIATERHRTMQGANSRNITKQVVATLRDEVSQLVGHPIEENDDALSITSDDDDLDSVAYAEREGIEDRLAQELLNKVVEDRNYLLSNGASIQPQNLNNVSSSAHTISESPMVTPVAQEHVVVTEGSPTRLEMKIDFDEKSEFSWLRENAQGNRVPVKFDFHAEHVITGSVDPTGRENFVLSNSGHYSEESRQALIKTNQELLASGAPRGVIIQHQLIIWAAKLDDAGRYFAVVRSPAGSGVAAMQETEFRLEVERAPRWPIHPLHPPEFIQPLSLRNARTNAGAECIELSCTVASNPTPRCLFYKNNSPVPVVILPLLNSEQDKSEITLSSFSRKYTVISCPSKQKVASVSVGYLRELILRISNPVNEDVASYTCRAWNYNGRTETSVKVSASDLSGRSRLRSADSQPSMLSERVLQTQTAVLNSAKKVEDTATTHGDILGVHRPSASKPPPSPSRIIIENESQNRVRSLSAGNPEPSNSLENFARKGSVASSVSSSYRPTYIQPNRNYESASPKQNHPRSPAVNTFVVSSTRDYPKNTLDSQHSHDSVQSPTSDAGSEVSSPFQRNSIRRSSAPKIVVDRRSQRRRSRSRTNVTDEDNSNSSTQRRREVKDTPL